MRPARGDWMEQERRELEESFRAISEQKTTSAGSGEGRSTGSNRAF
jgi:hypothetical protein